MPEDDKRGVKGPEPVEGPETQAATGPSTSSGPSDARRRTLRSVIRPGRGQLIAAVILFLVAIGVVMQVRANDADEAYRSAREEDLVQILDGLNSESRRLEEELESLQDTRERLRSGADRERVARDEARKRLDDLGILAGTVAAEGEGVRITITDPERGMGPGILLEGVQELRDAGAEAIEINNKVRVVASTPFGGNAGELTAGGNPISAPVVIEAIGDSAALSSGASFRGGFVDQIMATAGGSVAITEHERVVIDSLHQTADNQYAQPASSPSPSR